MSFSARNSNNVPPNNTGQRGLGPDPSSGVRPPSLPDESRERAYELLLGLEISDASLLEARVGQNQNTLISPTIIKVRLERRKERKQEIAVEVGCSGKQLDGMHASLTKFLESSHQEFLRRTTLDRARAPYSQFVQILSRLVKEMRAAGNYEDRLQALKKIDEDNRRINPAEKISESELRKLYGIILEESRCFEDAVKMKGSVKIGPQCVVIIPLLSIAADERLCSDKNTAHSLDFDNPIKNVWRDRWRQSLTRAVHERRIQANRAVSLPGITFPEQELSIYNSLGFREILAVERGREGDGGHSLKTFNYQIEKLSPHYPTVRAYPGELSDCLDSLSQQRKRTTTAAFDFDGYACEESLRTAHRLLLEEKAHVMINLLASREHQFLKDSWKAMMEMYPHLGECETPDERQYAALLRDYTFLYSIGVCREENWGPYTDAVKKLLLHWEKGTPIESSQSKREEVSRRVQFVNWYQLAIRDTCVWFMRAIPPIFMQIDSYHAHTMKERRFKGGLLTPQLLQPLPRLILNATLGLPLVQQIERIGYTSESSKARPPYHSFFATLHTPLSEYAKFRDLVEFFQQLISVAKGFTGLMRNAEQNLCLITKTNNLITSLTRMDGPDGVRFDDRICLMSGGHPRPEFSLQVDALVEGCRQYLQLEEGYFLRENNDIGKVAREFLTVNHASHSNQPGAYGGNP